MEERITLFMDRFFGDAIDYVIPEFDNDIHDALQTPAVLNGVRTRTVVQDRISEVTESKWRDKLEQYKTVEEIIQACPDTECTVCTDPLSVESDIGILLDCCHLTCLNCTKKLYGPRSFTYE